MRLAYNQRPGKMISRFTTCLFAVVVLVLFCSSYASAAKVLFVVGGGSLNKGDQVTKNHLKARGFEVSVQKDRSVTAKSAVGKDLVIISESVDSTKLKSKFRNVPVPVLSMEVYQYDDLGMTAPQLGAGNKFGYVDEQQNVRIKNSGTPLAANLPADYVVEVSPRDTTLGWGLPGKNAIRVATLLNSFDKYAIFAYQKGAKMPGLVAPAKRIGFFLTIKAAKSLSPEGWKLFNAAVTWAIAFEEPEGCPAGSAAITFVNDCSQTIWVAALGNGASKPCSSNADCGVNGQDGNCTNGSCVQVLCEADPDCNSTIQFCNVSNCSSDNDCPQINCYTDGDCPFSNDNATPQKCNGGGLCTSSASCSAIKCTITADCPQIAGVTCDTANGVCSPSCQSNGFCICNTSTDCPGPFATCQNNLCSETIGYCSPVCQPNGQCSCVTQSSTNRVNNCSGVGQTCQSNLCTGVGYCQYKNVPSPGYWQLPATVGKNTQQICVPADNTDTSNTKAWGGRFWGRTGCPDNFATCKPEGAPCDNSTVCCNNSCQGGVCQAGIPACLTGDCKNALNCKVSGTVPVTLFEVNYAAPNVAYYDASLADSYNVPIMATPSTAGCATAGCTSNLNATCPQPLQSLGTQSCTSDAGCPAGGSCQNGQCVVGCISACNLCTTNSNAPGLNCSEIVPGGTMTYQDLYCCSNNISCNKGNPTCFGNIDCATLGCTNNAGCGSDNCTAQGICADRTCNAKSLCSPSLSCMSNSDCNAGAGYTCVGGACVPPTNCCGPYNPQWLTAMQTFATAFKTACPSAYSYQFDDPSSSFTCPNNGQGVDYTITFCPSSGL